MKTRVKRILRALEDGEMQDGLRVKVKHWICEACDVVKIVAYDKKGEFWTIWCPKCKSWFYKLKSTEARVFVQKFLLSTIAFGNEKEKDRARTRLRLELESRTRVSEQVTS